MLIGDLASIYITVFKEPFGSDLEYSKILEQLILTLISIFDFTYDFWVTAICILIAALYGPIFYIVAAFYAFSIVSDFY